MNLVQVELTGGRTGFQPGETIAGTASWDLPGLPTGVEARLVWRAHGAGGEDEGVGAAVGLAGARSRDRRAFELVAPEGPYSYAGKLFSIEWAVEVVAQPGGQSGRVPIVIGPGGASVAGRG